LQNNGGTTETLALLSNSPAINAGDPNVSQVQDDQRGPGFDRVVGSRIDIGALESVYLPSPVQLAYANVPETVIAGQDFNIQVDVEDQFGNLVSNDSSNVRMSLTAAGSPLTNWTFDQASGGIADFAGMSIQKAGSYTLNVSDLTDGLGTTPLTLLVIPASPATLTVNSATGEHVVVGSAFAPLAVTLTDAFGNPVVGSSVTFSAVPGNGGATGTFSGNTTVTTNSQGIATAPSLTAGTIAGNFSVTASDGELANGFSLTSTPGAAASIVAIDGAGQNAVVGTPFAVPMQVLVTDAYGNPISDTSVTFTAPVAGATGVFSSIGTVLTNAHGIATAPTFAANNVTGSFNVRASVAGVAAAATFNMTVTGIPTAIIASSGSGQKAAVNSSFSSPLQALVTGANKQPIVGITVVFEVPSINAGAFAAGPITAVTNVNGIATSPLLLADTMTGSFTVLASVAGVATNAKFSLTNTAGTAASVSVLSGSEQSVSIGKAYAKPLEALVLDSFGNPVGGATVTFTAPNTGASGLFGKKSTITAVTNASGIAIASAFTANASTGDFNVIAAVVGVGTPASFDLTNLSSAPAKAKAFAGTPQSAAVDQAFGSALQVLVTNAQGKAVSGVWVTFSEPVSGASGNFNGTGSVSVQTNANGIATAPTLSANAMAGNFSAMASVSGLTGSVLFPLTNKPGTPTSVSVAAGSGERVGSGKYFPSPLAAIVNDAYGNVIGGVSVTFTIVPNSGVSGTFSNNQTTVTVTTNAMGLAVAPALKANSYSGNFTVIASVNNVAQDAVFSLTNY
jgi:hypothetical protein